MLNDDELERYSRHLVLKEIGGPGQLKLKSAKVGLVGVGGIGSPAALYLAAAGVGRLGLIDDDIVGVSNLQRQILYASRDVGMKKVDIAVRELTSLNPNTQAQPHPLRLGPDNVREIIGDYDLIIDGCDNFETRLLVNQACHSLAKPLVSAAIGRWSGQLSLFYDTPCYQCLVPTLPPDADTCERVGVVGALAGIMGAMAALEAIKWITGAGDPLRGKILMFDGLTMQSRRIRLTPDSACPICHGISWHL